MNSCHFNPTKKYNFKKQYLLVFLLPILVISLNSCTTTNTYTAIATSELTKQMLENPDRLPEITDGIEHNLLYYGYEQASEDPTTITYADVANFLKNNNNVDSVSGYCLVTYGEGTTETNTHETNTYSINYKNTKQLPSYKYRIRKCQEVNLRDDKLSVVERENSNGMTTAYAAGVLTPFIIIGIIALITAGSADSDEY